MFQNGFIIPQIGFKFDSIMRKNGFNNASCLPQQCLKSFEPILESFSRMLRGCVPDLVSLRFEFSFMNGSSFAYATWLRSSFGFATFRI